MDQNSPNKKGFRQQAAEYTGFLIRLLIHGEFDQVRYRFTRLIKHIFRFPSTLPLSVAPIVIQQPVPDHISVEAFQGGNSIAMAIHVYYLEIAINELAPLVNNRFGSKVDLFLSIPADTAPSDRVRLCSQFKGHVCLVPLPNQGRDILPFLTVLPTLINHQYDWVCKLHTKRSLHSPHGERWRHDLYRTLLSKRAVTTLLAAGPEYGLAYPWFSTNSLKKILCNNRAKMDEIVEALGLPHAPDSGRFVEGSMFWFRPHGLQLLTSITVEQYRDLFEYEQGQIDGTHAHAIERLFQFMISHEGLDSLRLT